MFCPPKFEKLTMPGFKNFFFSASNKSLCVFLFPTYEKFGKVQALFKSYIFPRDCLEALATNQNTQPEQTLNQSYLHYQEHFIGTITNTLPLIAPDRANTQVYSDDYTLTKWMAYIDAKQ